MALTYTRRHDRRQRSVSTLRFILLSFVLGGFLFFIILRGRILHDLGLYRLAGHQIGLHGSLDWTKNGTSELTPMLS